MTPKIKDMSLLLFGIFFVHFLSAETSKNNNLIKNPCDSIKSFYDSDQLTKVSHCYAVKSTATGRPVPKFTVTAANICIAKGSTYFDPAKKTPVAGTYYKVMGMIAATDGKESLMYGLDEFISPLLKRTSPEEPIIDSEFGLTLINHESLPNVSDLSVRRYVRLNKLSGNVDVNIQNYGNVYSPGNSQVEISTQLTCTPKLQ